jgi:hypothetical protein
LGGGDPDDPDSGGDPDNPNEITVNVPIPGDTVVEITAPGNTKAWTPPVDGYYLIELWGSQGWNPSDDPNNEYGGKGAYVRGVLQITQEEVAADQTLYVTVGVGTDPTREGYGGGASDMRWGEDTLYGRIIVAAGGGGSHDKSKTDVPSPGGYSYGGCGGALTGVAGTGGASGHNGGGGTQTAGGTTVSGGQTGAFGTGGFVSSRPIDSNESYNDVGESKGSGGSGYWGGGSGGNGNYNGPGGGGSSFISGYDGCVAIVASGGTSPRTDEDTAVKATHYSGKVFDSSVMIDGSDYTTVMIAGNKQMPEPASENGETEIGHIGGGYARVVYLGKPSTEP